MKEGGPRPPGHKEEAAPPELALPDNMTADQLLNDVSEKDRAAMAQGHNLTIAEFDRYLNARARRERIASSIAAASIIKQKVVSEARELDEHKVKAEAAVIKGLEESVQKYGPEDLTADEIEELERQAYALCEEADIAGDYTAKATFKRKKAAALFERVLAVNARKEIAAMVATGVGEEEARKQVGDAMKELSPKQNLSALRQAFHSTGSMFAGNFQSWKARETRQLVELENLISAYNSKSMQPEQIEMLGQFVKAAKGNYVGGMGSEKDSAFVHRYRRMMPIIYDAYRKYGPYKRQAEGVVGPSEIYTSYQSDHVAGYRRDSKARPHRDTSGGNGEKY